MKRKASYSKALITGGCSGLGKALGDFLETQNINVLRTSSETHDLTTPDGRTSTLSLITQEKPDLIVNNAGIGLYGPALSHPIEDQLRIIDVNIRALTEITLHSAKTLSRGTILNISSAGGFLSYPTFALYCASKAYVNNVSLALDSELRSQGIRVLCACPGQIATNFRSRAAKGHPQERDQRTMSPQTAVRHLWHQLQTKKPLYIFDWKTRWMMYLSKLIPRPLLEKALVAALKPRYSQT